MPLQRVLQRRAVPKSFKSNRPQPPCFLAELRDPASQDAFYAFQHLPPYEVCCDTVNGLDDAGRKEIEVTPENRKL